MTPTNNIEDENSALKGKGFSDKIPFNVPENYFETLTDKILENIELKSVSPFLAELRKENPFNVPENYLEKHGIQIPSESIITIAEIAENNPFITPENYFENLAERIAENTSEKEISSLEKKSPFLIPENYFGHLCEKILSKTSEKREAKIVSFRSYFSTYKYSAFAVAASVAAIISFYFYYPSSQIKQEIPQYVSAEDISNSTYMDDLDESILIEEAGKQKVKNPSSDIENYLIENDVDENTIINEL